MVDEQIGRRLKLLRNLAGLKRTDFEEWCGVSQHTLQSWELGRNPLSVNNAMKLVAIFYLAGILTTPEWILQGTGAIPHQLVSIHSQ